MYIKQRTRDSNIFLADPSLFDRFKHLSAELRRLRSLRERESITAYVRYVHDIISIQDKYLHVLSTMSHLPRCHPNPLSLKLD
jgi:formate dehydrogenase maturation protein FdhE